MAKVNADVFIRIWQNTFKGTTIEPLNKHLVIYTTYLGHWCKKCDFKDFCLKQYIYLFEILKIR